MCVKSVHTHIYLSHFLYPISHCLLFSLFLCHHPKSLASPQCPSMSYVYFSVLIHLCPLYHVILATNSSLRRILYFLSVILWSNMKHMFDLCFLLLAQKLWKLVISWVLEVQGSPFILIFGLGFQFFTRHSWISYKFLNNMKSFCSNKESPGGFLDVSWSP